MWIQDIDFSPVGEDHLDRRARIRWALEDAISNGLQKHLEKKYGKQDKTPATQEELDRAIVAMSRDRDPLKIVSPESVARALALRVEKAIAKLEREIANPEFGGLLVTLGLAPELALVIGAMTTLSYILNAEEGLAMRCVDLREDLDFLESALSEVGEEGGLDTLISE